MSKLRKYTSFDDNPNSDIAASKRVVKEYKKLLEKEKLEPIMKEMNNQTKSAVTNLNDYSLLLKNITQNLVNADLYLSNPEVSKSKGAGRFIGGVRLTDKQKIKIFDTAAINNIYDSAQALNYIQEKYRDKPKGTKLTVPDRNLIKAFGLGNIGATTDAEKAMGKIGNNTVPDEDIPEVLSGVAPEKGTPIAKQIIQTGINPLQKSVTELRSRESSPYSSEVTSPSTPFGIGSKRATKISSKLSALIDEGKAAKFAALENEFESRFSQKPQQAALSTGLRQNEDEEEDFDYDDTFGKDDRNDELGEKAEIPVDSGKYVPENGDDDGGNDEDEFTNLDDLIKNRKNTPIRENFIITLFSNIINQVHKASDFWETNITPNLSDIPKLKMDSFIKSNAVNNFENAIIRFEDTLISGTIKTHLNYLDNIYHNLTTALDDLFTRMNIDIKRYAGGLSSSNDKPQLMGAGYLPFRGSVYSSHLRDSNTKYLM